MPDTEANITEGSERPSALHVGEWLVQPRLHRMRKGDEQVQMEPRLMRVLMCLVEAGGEVVTRQEILDLVWPEAVVCEEVLTQAVSELRRFFGDKARTPRYIETIRKGGYRLVAPIRRSDPGVPESAPVALDHEAVPAPVPEKTRRPSRQMNILLLVVVLLATVATIWRVWFMTPPDELSPKEQSWSVPVPLTSYPGREATPALSPDGMKVAFAWAPAPGGDLDIYVKSRGRETPVRITVMPGPETMPVWSPDGSRLACLGGEEATIVHIIAAEGGEAREVYRADHRIEGLDWAPDGETLAVAVRTADSEACRILALSTETGTTNPLTRPPFLYSGDSQPRYSPDGTRLAFVRRDMAHEADIHVITLADGELSRLTTAQRDIAGLDWSPDGAVIVFAAAPMGHFSLWRVSIETGQSRPHESVMGEARFPTIASRSGDMAFENIQSRVDIHRLDLDELGRALNPTTPVIVSSRRDYAPDLSADGRELAFLSDRSGHIELWTSRADGRNPRQRTRFLGAWISNPQWSSGGGTIAFNAAPDGNPAIFLLDEDVPEPRRLTPLGQRERFCCWSADGQWIYFAADPNQTWQIYRMYRDGTRVERVSTRGGLTARIGVDGESLYFTKPGQAGLWIKESTDGSETRISDLPAVVDRSAWAVGSGGFYFLRSLHGGARLEFLPVDGGEIQTVARLPEVGADGLDLADTYLLLPVLEAEESDLRISLSSK